MFSIIVAAPSAPPPVALEKAGPNYLDIQWQYGEENGAEVFRSQLQTYPNTSTTEDWQTIYTGYLPTFLVSLSSILASHDMGVDL